MKNLKRQGEFLQISKDIRKLLLHIGVQADNAIRNLDAGTRIDIERLKENIDEILNTIMDYHDHYGVIMNRREIIEE